MTGRSTGELADSNTDEQGQKVEEKEKITRSQKVAKRWEKRAQRRLDRDTKRKARKKWHILNILRGIWLFFFTLFKILFFPFVFLYRKSRDTYKFISKRDAEDLELDLISEEDGDAIPLGYIDEKKYLRSLPWFYFLSGLLGAVLTIFITFEFMKEFWKDIGDFLRSLTWQTVWSTFVDILERVFVEGIYEKILIPIGNGFQWLFAPNRFWIPLTVLIVIGVGLIFLAIILSEAEGKVIQKIRDFFTKIGNWFKNGFKKIQVGLSRFTFGERKLKYYEKRFFYRVVIYSSAITLWIILSLLIVVIVVEAGQGEVQHDLVYPIMLTVIGIINGVFLLAFLSWFIGILSGDRYIIDKEAHDKFLEDRTKAKEEKKQRKASRRS
ncbi:MAG: hypothetical protein FK733_05700 [Asgard group archaeon]|nr:hypothetical protein [Asgard group archaeon]